MTYKQPDSSSSALAYAQIPVEEHAAPSPVHEEQTTLFCIPHAGGSANYYSSLSTFLPANISLSPIELAGRGRRRKIPLCTTMEELCDDMFIQITSTTRSKPYAIFGHSMGALLAFLCSIKIQKHHLPLPKALFLSAATTPHKFHSTIGTPISSLTDAERWQHLINLGGVPEAVAESKELSRYFAPIIYADFTALESWTPPHISRIPVPIHVFLGNEDALSETEALQWKDLTTKDFSIQAFRGNHFYLQNNWDALADKIAKLLSHTEYKCP